MNRSCPNCDARVKDRTNPCPNCRHSLAPPPENEAAQVQPQSQEPAEPEQASTQGTAEQEERSSPTDFETTDQETTDQHSVLEDRSPAYRVSLKDLLPTVYAAGGVLGVVMVLLVGAALPTAVILLSTVGLTLKLVWLVTVGTIFAATIVLLRANLPASAGEPRKRSVKQRERPPLESEQERHQAEIHAPEEEL